MDEEIHLGSSKICWHTHAAYQHQTREKRFPLGPTQFNKIKRLMTSLPCLKNVDYNLDNPLWLFTNASGSGLGAALFQGKDWKLASPITYESHLMTPAEQNYPFYEQELLAVVHALQKWKTLLFGMKVHVMSDHHLLVYLMKQRSLLQRQACWTELLAKSNLKFEYILGKDYSIADALSCKDNTDDLSVMANEVSCIAAMSKFWNKLLEAIRAEIVLWYEIDLFCVYLQSTLPLRDNCAVLDNPIIIDNYLLIPATGNLCACLMDEAHLRLGHLGYLKTITELCRDFFWPKMARDVLEFVSLCKVCQKTKATTTSPTGKMLTPDFPQLPLSHISINFIFPLKTSNQYYMLLTVTCWLSGFTCIIPTLQKDSAKKMASCFFAGWITLFGAPATIISNRNKTWASKFWSSLISLLSICFHRSSASPPKS